MEKMRPFFKPFWSLTGFLNGNFDVNAVNGAKFAVRLLVKSPG